MTPRSTVRNEDLVSIGDLASRTGVSVDTIRVWERRYGKPVPVRLPSGHRRYTEEHVRWLRRVAEAMAAGQRPGRVVRLDEKELDELLEGSERTAGDDVGLDRILDLVRDYRRDDLEESLYGTAEKLGPRAFLARMIAPLLTGVGRRWADGELEVRHEHFFSEILEDLLRALRQGLDVSEDGPVVLLTTLSGEQHSLGLHMAALSTTLAGARPVILGVNSPNEEIASAAAECEAEVVAVSVSLATGSVRTDRVLGELRKLLPEDVRLVVGGKGARGVRRGPRGVDYVDGLEGLESYLGELA